MYRTDDIHFTAYLDSVGVRWLKLDRNSRGRTDFVFDLPEEEATQHRVNFANHADLKRYAASLDFVQKVIQDSKRNTGGTR